MWTMKGGFGGIEQFDVHTNQIRLYGSTVRQVGAVSYRCWVGLAFGTIL